jgi:hypothetical protein
LGDIRVRKALETAAISRLTWRRLGSSKSGSKMSATLIDREVAGCVEAACASVADEEDPADGLPPAQLTRSTMLSRAGTKYCVDCLKVVPHPAIGDQ